MPDGLDARWPRRWRWEYLAHHTDPLDFGHSASQFSDPRQDCPSTEQIGDSPLWR
jgi:hypothetical protein